MSDLFWSSVLYCVANCSTIKCVDFIYTIYAQWDKKNVHNIGIYSDGRFKNKGENTEKYFYQSTLLNLVVYRRNSIHGASGSSI